MNPERPNFEAAKAQFQEFLGKCEYAQKILWLMPEDVLVSGEQFVYVRIPVPTCNEAKVYQMYNEGIARGRGVLMSTVCEMLDSTCCYVWFPKDGEEGHKEERYEIRCCGHCCDCDTERSRARKICYLASSV